jgi:hypothetical protein
MASLLEHQNSGSALAVRSESEMRTLAFRRSERELSVGLEVECWLPDLRRVLPKLRLLRSNEELFAAVAEALSARIAALVHRRGGGARHTTRSRHVSSDRRDWGRLWTAAPDTSIAPSPSAESRAHDDAPFPFEVVSHVMRFDAVDVEEFIDIAAALRQPPLSAKTNDSTGFHVHVGRAFGRGNFFAMEEVAAIAKAWCTFEETLSSFILPLARRGNAYCRDLRDILGAGARRGSSTTAAAVRHVDDVVARLREFRRRGLSEAARKGGVRGRVGRDALRMRVAGDDAQCVIKNRGVDDWLTATAPDGDAFFVPPGLELAVIRDAATGAEIWRRDAAQSGGQQIWRALGCESDGDAPMTPTLALDFDLDKAAALDIDGGLDALHVEEEATSVDCVFAAPLDIDEDDERLLRLLLVRSLLPHNANKVGPEPSRYTKLNLTRCTLPASEATVEFRSFPGDVLQRPLATLGWVRFCGALVTAACAGAPLPDVGDEAALLRFAGLRDDAMMGAWWRECANRVRPAELELETVITSFAERFDTWLAAARRASIESAENDDAALVAACDEWRSVFAATASLRQMVPPDDARVWGRVQRAQEEAREFIQLLGTRLLERLDRFREDLTARCECASRCGLTTTHRLCCGEDFARECADVRALRAAVEETRGADVLMSTDALPRLRASVLSIDKLSARLAHHLLLLCEGLTGGAALTRNGSGVNEESRALVAVHAFLGASLTRPDAFVIFEGLAEHGWTDARFAAIEAAVARAQKSDSRRVSVR